MLEWIFWAALLLGIYPYVFYPMGVWLLGQLFPRRISSDRDFLPRITIVTAAFNEARHIEATVRNKLSQDYPHDLLEMLVVSDSSDDGTDAWVERVAGEDPRVRLIRQETRGGKTAALNIAVPQAAGEIIVFADANSLYRPNALRVLTAAFADPAVGYVTGRMLYVNTDGSTVGDGCTAYMRYENFLRDAESRIGSIVGVDGGVDAVRKSLYVPMRPDQLPDFVLPLSVVQQGFRCVYEPAAILTEETLGTSAAEARMRVRVALRAFWALWDKRAMLWPWPRPLFCWQLWSHKLLRYLSFLPLAVASATNWLLLSDGVIYLIAAAGQLLLLAVAVAAGTGIAGRWPPTRYAYYFLLLNWTSATAFIRFLRGQKQQTWQPRTG